MRGVLVKARRIVQLINTVWLMSVAHTCLSEQGSRKTNKESSSGNFSEFVQNLQMAPQGHYQSLSVSEGQGLLSSVKQTFNS